jgi:hypothetical protein
MYRKFCGGVMEDEAGALLVSGAGVRGLPVF